MVFPGGSVVKNLPAMQEIQVQSLDWEDPVEEGTATNSSILAWRIHAQRSLVGYSPWGPKRVGRDLATITTDICVINHQCMHTYLCLTLQLWTDSSVRGIF